MVQEENQTEEMLLLACSPHITGYNIGVEYERTGKPRSAKNKHKV